MVANRMAEVLVTRNHASLDHGQRYESDLTQNAALEPAKPLLPAILCVVYMWWFLTTPMYSNRLAFLADWKFERLLAGIFIIVSLAQGKLSNLLRPIPMLLFLLACWMWVCAIMSPYANVLEAVHWRDNYWKLLVFFACVTLSVSRVGQIRVVLIGVAWIIFLYQIYSWIDFVRGGSYVYQQGMKRMIGVWSPRGYGGGNAWGYLGLFGVPLAITWCRLSRRQTPRVLALAFLVSTCLCIVYSGTRGAMVVALVYLLYVFRKQLLKVRTIVICLMVVLTVLPVLPTGVRHRMALLVVQVDDENATGADKIAEKSAEGRWRGLINGFQLAQRSPFFGCGPAASPDAALDLRRELGTSPKDDHAMQLHNLYGQLAGELGYVGFALWSLLIVVCVVRGFAARRRQIALDVVDRRALSVFWECLLGMFVVFVIYGMAGHTLYDEKWLLLFGLVNSYENLDVN